MKTRGEQIAAYREWSKTSAWSKSAAPASSPAPSTAARKSTLAEGDYKKMSMAERIEAGRVTRAGGTYVPHWRRDRAYVAAANERRRQIAAGKIKKQPWD